jgi:hypothetical protein
VFIAVDDVYQALDTEEVDAYTKRLYELLWRLYEMGAKAATVVVATSEGASRRLLASHSYVLLKML